MTANLIDGKAMAADLRTRVSKEVRNLAARHHIIPGLAVIQMGDDPPSEIYTANKKKMLAETGMHPIDHRLPASASQSELLALIARLNEDRDVDGILVQLPLPPHIDSHVVIAAIDPAKDVDGFHPLNVGRVAVGQPALAPCTPLAWIMLAKSVHLFGGSRRSGDRAFHHCWQAAGTAASRRKCDRDGRPRKAGTCPCSRARPTYCLQPSAELNS